MPSHMAGPDTEPAIRAATDHNSERAPLECDRIGAALSAWLGIPIASFRILASGWETTLFEFALAARSPRMPDAIPGAPLVLRFYANATMAAAGAREFETIRALTEAGYPVPRPHLFEADSEPLGAPFLVMDRLAGVPLFGINPFPVAFKNFSLGFLGFVRAHARLHRLAEPDRILARALDVAGGPSLASRANPLDFALATIADRVARGPLPGLADALANLVERAPRFRGDAPPSFLHMDYHPQNVIVSGMRVTGVIDWSHAAVGDRHFDAATTAAILATSSMEHPRWMRDNVAGNSLRLTFNALYVALYHAIAPIRFERLRYFQGVAAVERLSMLAMMRARGPESVGFRPEAIAEVTPSVLKLLGRYASRKTGAPIRVP